jgi:hypothetical protein
MAEAWAERGVNFLLLYGEGTAGAVKARKNKSNIMSEHLDIHWKDMMNHMQRHAFHPFAFGKSILPETSVF